jgi:allantoinase
MDNKLYDYSPIVSRPKLAWPNGARIAFYIGLNIEHFEIDKPATSIFGATAAFVPDPLNYGWRDYGCPPSALVRQIQRVEEGRISGSS